MMRLHAFRVACLVPVVAVVLQPLAGRPLAVRAGNSGDSGTTEIASGSRASRCSCCDDRRPGACPCGCSQSDAGEPTSSAVADAPADGIGRVVCLCSPEGQPLSAASGSSGFPLRTCDRAGDVPALLLPARPPAPQATARRQRSRDASLRMSTGDYARRELGVWLL